MKQNNLQFLKTETNGGDHKKDKIQQIQGANVCSSRGFYEIKEIDQHFI